ncbi:WD40 repeat-like protein [Xylariaceae sp. FL0016]|nr:WD40 repeat-like protein [Xylariaceae sp. FL0016]
MSTEREYLVNPITALAFWTSRATGRRYLLAGEDTNLRVYDCDDVIAAGPPGCRRLVGVLPVFAAQPVHGIAVPDVDDAARQRQQILVWGGCSVRVLDCSLIEDLDWDRDASVDIVAGDAVTVSGAGRKEGEPGGGLEPRSRHLCMNDAADGEGDSDARGTAEARAPDWILDGRISPFARGRVVLLTAHNEIIEARVSADVDAGADADGADGRSRLVFERVQSPSRPILYSGNLYWVERDVVLVAAGTAFGEILVWRCYLGEGEEAGEVRSEVLFMFEGHEGSIFGVHISPEIRDANGETRRFLASCSDDRSMRIWDITMKGDDIGLVKGGYWSQISNARETGFLNSDERSLRDEGQTRCVATAMGHLSRIWQVEFPQMQRFWSTHSILEFYSFGEDSTCQKWHVTLPTGSANGASPATNTTYHTKFANHSGKNLWSHSMTYAEDGSLLVATGGADGKITLVSDDMADYSTGPEGDRQELCTKGNEVLRYSLTDLIGSSPSLNAAEADPNGLKSNGRNVKHTIQRYAFLGDDSLLTISSLGRVFKGSLRDDIRWNELPISNDISQTLFSYSVLESTPSGSMALVGTAGGDVYSYSNAESETFRPLTKFSGKIAEIICLNESDSRPNPEEPVSQQAEFLISVLGSTKAQIMKIDSSDSILNRNEVELEKGFMPTAASYCQNHLVIGSRNGIVTVFNQDLSGSYLPTLSFKVKVKDAITSILPLPNQHARIANHFLVTSRDGKYRIYTLRHMKGELSVLLVNETVPPLGPMIEASWIATNSDGTQDLFLCGFRSTLFVAWNATRREEVAVFDCGGAHRSFAFTPLRNNLEGVRFVCTKNAEMVIYSKTSKTSRTLKTGTHGREIKAVSAAGRYVATAAEDTVIRIWEYPRQDNLLQREFRCVAALEKHSAGIQSMKWHENQYLFSSAGNEEFFVWRIHALDNDVVGLGIVCEAVFPDRTEVGDLRIMDFDFVCTTPSINGPSGQEGGAKLVISMALSNSSLQCYTYSQDDGFQLLGRRSYTGACLTQMRILALDGEGHPQVLTAATDGHLAVHPDTDGEVDEVVNEASQGGVTVSKLHQSTVKALDVRKMGPDHLVVTGGDDNALGVAHLRSPVPQAAAPAPTARTAPTTPPYDVISKSVVRSAHAAAITGLAIARLENGGEDALLVSCSNDQRVKLWRVVGWRAGTGRVRVQLLDERYSSIADAGDLEVIEGEGGGEGRIRVMVGGVGVEVWDIGSRGLIEL